MRSPCIIVLFIALASFIESANANGFHKYLEGAKVDARAFSEAILELEDPSLTLSELDENGLTVLGKAISCGREEVVQLLLHLGFSDIGPMYRHTTMAEFAFNAKQLAVHVFLAYFENDRSNGFKTEEALLSAIRETRAFEERQRKWRALSPVELPRGEKLLGPGGYLSVNPKFFAKF